MRIRVLRNLGRGLPPLKEGQVADVDDAMGEKLVRQRLAEQIHSVVQKPIRAIPPDFDPKYEFNRVHPEADAEQVNKEPNDG